MALIKWKRPSGSFIETNDSKATVAHAELMKWERVKKRGRKAKTLEALDDGGNSERHNQECITGDISTGE